MLCFVFATCLSVGLLRKADHTVAFSSAQAGSGGMLKMWDPELRDTSAPLCQVDLRAFVLKGDAVMNAKVVGRAMDWTTSKDLLR